MINKTLQDRLDNSDTRSFTKSDWNMLIPFYATYDAVKYGARNAFKSRGEAIKYSLVWDVSALQMYSLMGALILKGLGLIGS